ncbi:N-lysine methyltransferase KMT5A-like [Acanthaster planci]|uniref:N-lysine methyltransferase KMT5A-like n=1 Tax=Acanthaster planci TaxID=133434 RepID=A0A8B7ZNY9_ACAPL|nr:N-lysine methyltransferase KMT5A-like [Acanthaster planci]
MGKRNRKQKKEATSSEGKIAPVPDKSPRISEEKPAFAELKEETKSPQLPAKDDKSSKITSYFPKSPEGRQKPIHPPAESLSEVAEQDKLLAAVTHLPPPSLLTPDTTPTKEYTQPPPNPRHHTGPLPPRQSTSETQDARGEPAGRPRAAQKLDYGTAAHREEGARDDGSTEDKVGGVERKEGVSKMEDGKPSRRGRGRSRKTKQNKQVHSPSMTLKDYFPVRRSNRRCKSAIESSLGVDATAESGRIGRLLNHSKSGNCTTKLISIDDRPYLILVAARPITAGEELVYDYGDRNKESLRSHPWLAL